MHLVNCCELQDRLELVGSGYSLKKNFFSGILVVYLSILLCIHLFSSAPGCNAEWLHTIGHHSMEGLEASVSSCFLMLSCPEATGHFVKFIYVAVALLLPFGIFRVLP